MTRRLQTAPPPVKNEISDVEFAQFQKLIFKIAGISLSDRKKDLVTGRLTRRVDHFGFNSFAQYYRHVSKDEHAGERQIMVDLDSVKLVDYDFAAAAAAKAELTARFDTEVAAQPKE